MKRVIKLYLLIILVIFGNTVIAQDIRFTTGLGVSAYMGDLITDRIPILKQVSGDLSIGATADIKENFRARLNVSFLGVRGDDAKSNRIDRQARNLNFKSSVWEISVMGEFDFLDKEVYNIVPYAFGGIGLFHFNPYTNDAIAGKVFLHDVGTEGQYLGQSGYPAPYKRTQLNIPLGLGIRYAISDELSLGIEFNYRFLFTDYLDDVSSSKYVNPALFSTSSYYTANNNYYGDLASRLGYRSTDPKYSLNYARGNPGKKDAFYSFQITASFKLSDISIGNSPFGGAGYNRSRHYTY